MLLTRAFLLCPAQAGHLRVWIDRFNAVIHVAVGVYSCPVIHHLTFGSVVRRLALIRVCQFVTQRSQH
jgi:hypothetical protein